MQKGKRFTPLAFSISADKVAPLLTTPHFHKLRHFFFREHGTRLFSILVDASDAILAGFYAASFQPVDDV